MIIYLITNKISGKQYIGQKVNLRGFDTYWGSGNYIKNAIKKYGISNFEKTILESDISDREQLNYRERYWISQYNTLHPNGYNLSTGGEGMVGYKHSNITKVKIGTSNAIALRGNIVSQKTKDKISASTKGKKLTPETREKISKSRIGIKFSKEHIEKLRLTSLGRTHTQEQKNKISKSLIGKTHTEASKHKMSIIAKNRVNDINYIHKLSKALMGHVVSEETRNKIRETFKRKREQNESNTSNNTKNT